MLKDSVNSWKENIQYFIVIKLTFAVLEKIKIKCELNIYLHYINKTIRSIPTILFFIDFCLIHLQWVHTMKWVWSLDGKFHIQKKKSLYFVSPCHQLVPWFREMQEKVFDHTKTGLSLRAGTAGDPPPPSYFHKKIEEKQNPQKSLAIWFPAYCCIYPADTWNLSDSPAKSQVMHCYKWWITV